MVLRPAKEHSGYTSSDRARFVDEPSKRAGRTEFGRDRARIIHSWALRRLAAKTQVLVPWEEDFPRTRLSHSLECAQVGRELGSALGADPDLMEGACLAHDIGHSPFGHNGEDALNEIAQSCGGFEGNAQSFRLLTRIEAKTVNSQGKSVGLNLTRASLDAATKYPWSRETNARKFGVYDDDLEIFNWVREGAPVGVQSMEAQIMDWSDDVAYSVHDFEDALVMNHFEIQNLERDLPGIYLGDKDGHLRDMSEEDAEVALRNLQALSAWPKSYDGSHRGLAQLKDLTSELIGRFALASEQATRDKYGDGDLTRYSAHLVVPTEQRNEVALLKSIGAFYVIETLDARPKYESQQALLKELVEMVYSAGESAINSFFIGDWRDAASDSARLRVVIDQVASLTDPGAYALHKELGGGR